MSLTIKAFGPPGCGKTSFLLSQIKGQLNSGVWPQDILFCSFTKAAAYHGRDEILGEFPEYTKEDFPNIGTLHSIAFRLLGLNRNQVFKKEEFSKIFPIYKFSGEEETDAQLIEEYSTQTAADYCESFQNWERNMMIANLDDAYRQFKRIYSEPPSPFSIRYLKDYLERREKYKEQEGKVDFTDMLELCLKNGLTPDIEVFILDEGQDCSLLQMTLAKQWMSRAQTCFLASDPYQCLYNFQAADPNLMIDLKADDTFTLKQSYRVPRLAHDLSRKIVERFKIRYPDDDYEPVNKDGEIRKVNITNVNLNYTGKTFYLFRTRYLLEQQFNVLYEKGIPFITKRGRHSPFDKKEREVAYTLLRLIRGESLSLSNLVDILDKMPSRRGNITLIKHGAKKEIEDKARENSNHRIDKDSLPFLGFTMNFLSLLNEQEFLELIRMDSSEKEYFMRVLSRHGIKAFLEMPKLILGTIHSVKGLESDNVLIDLSMTRKPWESFIKDPDSERRVFYVGITRTKDILELVIPDNYNYFVI